MRYTEFRDRILAALLEQPAGLTWKELKQQLGLPYRQPCPTWVAQLEREIGLTRGKEKQPAYVWKLTRTEGGQHG